MFIIFGWREKAINVLQNQKYRCVNCREEAVSFFFFIKYIHIFWIPAFPFGKNVVSYCEKCSVSYENKSIPETLQRQLELIKPQIKTPLYFFAATFLVIIALVYGLVVGL